MGLSDFLKGTQLMCGWSSKSCPFLCSINMYVLIDFLPSMTGESVQVCKMPSSLHLGKLKAKAVWGWRADIFAPIWVPCFKDIIRLVISGPAVYNNNNDKEESMKQHEQNYRHINSSNFCEKNKLLYSRIWVLMGTCFRYNFFKTVYFVEPWLEAKLELFLS